MSSSSKRARSPSVSPSVSPHDRRRAAAAATIQAHWRGRRNRSEHGSVYTEHVDPISLQPVPRFRNVELNKQHYDAASLERWIATSPIVPHSKRRLTAAEIAEIHRLADKHRGAATPATRVFRVARAFFAAAQGTPPRQAFEEQGLTVDRLVSGLRQQKSMMLTRASAELGLSEVSAQFVEDRGARTNYLYVFPWRAQGPQGHLAVTIVDNNDGNYDAEIGLINYKASEMNHPATLAMRSWGKELKRALERVGNGRIQAWWSETPRD